MDSLVYLLRRHTSTQELFPIAKEAQPPPPMLRLKATGGAGAEDEEAEVDDVSKWGTDEVSKWLLENDLKEVIGMH